MTNTRLTHYQGLLLDTPRMQFMPPTALNPATMLRLPSKEAPLHDCQEILADTMTVRPDLKDTPLSNSDLMWFTDGSSFVQNSHGYAGVTIVDKEGGIVWSETLPQGTSALRAELIVLAEALE